MADTLLIPRRFCGPASSGNGGYTCGALAAFLDGDTEVTLRGPPPLDRPMDVERSDNGVRALLGDQVIAEARPTAFTLQVPPPPSLEEATRASSGFPWREGHPYPRCFVCGTQRSPGDGLCIHPGAVEGRNIAAAPFVPDPTLAGDDGRLRRDIVWAALDCPSWFGFQCTNAFTGEMLLGRLATRIDALPRIGDRCICVGWSLGREGRKVHCASALYSADGELLASARATWIVLK